MVLQLYFEGVFGSISKLNKTLPKYSTLRYECYKFIVGLELLIILLYISCWYLNVCIYVWGGY